ncbi:MAG: ferredoxin family protein [Thermoanaerobacter sp.]|nr:ferredoxin family protein [Thermoanaerobacter sp.]
MSAVIDTEKCIGCGVCEDNCPGDLIYIDEKTGKAVVAYPEECWFCGSCRMDCPEECIKIIFPMEIIL